MQTTPTNKTYKFSESRPPRAFRATFKFTGYRHVPLAARDCKVTPSSRLSGRVGISGNVARSCRPWGAQSRRLYEVHRRGKVVATILRELREEDWFHVGD
jgi:hypothetical protein